MRYPDQWQVADGIQKIENFLGIIQDVHQIDELMALEGNARNEYYKQFDKITQNEFFAFESRTKRPPKNRMNALISFGNSILYSAVLSEIYKTHLDPRIGYLHTSNFRRFSLNLDIAEIFKPIIVDRVIFSLINKSVLKENMFEARVGKVILNDRGKKIFIEEMENRFKSTIRHSKLRRNVSYRQLILLECYKLEKHLLGEKEYTPFIAQW
jgi:CRISPR-associated protein Cas1